MNADVVQKTLYICYFGVREPLVQSQVLPYLRELRKKKPRRGEEESGGLAVSLLTFEPDTSLDASAIREGLAAEGIDWHWLPYHKRFSAIATAWDIFRGALFVRSFIARERPDVLHGRVHVATLMGALGRRLSRHKPKLLFDIRGFFPEEYTDAGVWPANGLMYRTAKRVERWLLKEADAFVVLTEKARDILFPESRDRGRDKHARPVEVIPCCVDLKRFSAADSETRSTMRRELGVEGRRVIVYVGSFGGWYMTDEMLDLFSAAREQDPNIFPMVLTQRNPELVAAELRARGIQDADHHVGSVEPGDLPRYLVAGDIALSFIKACYSKQSSSPTKIAEYLACGLPIIANRGVGDVDEIIDGHGVGSLIEKFDPASYVTALDAVTKLNGVSEACRATAASEFDLESVGGVRYRRVYSNLLAGD